MPETGSWSPRRLQSFTLLLLTLRLQPSLSYSLKNCTISHPDNELADIAVDCSARQLNSVPDDIPRRATSIRMNLNHIQKIYSTDFNYLSKLRYLTISTNSIAHVDDGSFVHLVSLVELEMDSNDLTQLSGNLFKGLSNLLLLNLSNNNIKFIASSAFQFLSRLQTLMLDSNQLHQLTDIQPILQLPHIQAMNLQNNKFTSFQSKELPANMSSGLRVLNLSSNPLKRFSITTKIFPHLESIDLTSCGKDVGFEWDIPDKSFLRNITHLYFSNSYMTFKCITNILQSLDSLVDLQLSYMTKWIDRGLLNTACKIPTLRTLDLHYNNIVNISKKLPPCSQLNKLDLSSNHITKLSNDSIGSMQQLRYLTMETNSLSKVPDDIKSLSSLEFLLLGFNSISQVGCSDFLNLTLLTELHLNDNYITELHGCVFQNLNDLKVLNVRRNLMWTFGDSFKVGLEKLEFLDMSDNFVLSLENGDFKSLKSLRYLDVQSTKITRVHNKAFVALSNLVSLSVSLPSEINNVFRGLRSLQNLTIHLDSPAGYKGPRPNYSKTFSNLYSLKNFIIICTDFHAGFPFYIPINLFQSMKNLEHFTAENFFVEPPDIYMFDYTPRLKSLNIRQTDLSDLNPLLFEPIPNLEALDLSYNKLNSLDFLAQANLSRLTWLRLSHNDLTVINETVLRLLPALTYLDMEDNYLTCDCSNSGFQQWLQTSNQTQVVNAYQYTCTYPMSENGNKFMDFDIQSCWMDTSFFCYICSTCVIMLTLLTSFTYHFLRWQLAYAYYLFLAFLYDSRKRKAAPYRYDAFISYNVHDEAWVLTEMLPVLEGEQGWRLCLHHRDFQPGKPIIENITEAIYSSRKTICVISQRYLESDWCSREIQMASFRLFDEKKDVLILVFLEELPAQKLSPYYRMRKLVKRQTYLSWSQAGQHPGLFWQNVCRALETGDSPTDHTQLLTGPQDTIHDF